MVPVSTGDGSIGPVNQIFNFIAVKEGQYKLDLSLIAPWRPTESAAVKSYDVTISAPKASAKDDIAQALKGRDFVNAATVNVGDNPAASQVLKYAAPMANLGFNAVQTSPLVVYAAPMVNPSVCGCQTSPVILYAAPMATPGSMAAMTSPVILYAAPMVGSMAAQTAPLVVYAAPMATPGSMAAQTTPLVVYAAPMASPGPVAAQGYQYGFNPWLMNLAGMQAGYNPSMMMPYAAPQTAYNPAMIQPYAAPQTAYNPQMFNAAQFPLLRTMPGYQMPLNQFQTMAVTMVAYGVPYQGGLLNSLYGMGYQGCC
jgi:hypothetical protein